MSQQDNINSSLSNSGSQPNLPAPQGRGCLFYGCMTVLVLFVLICIGGYFAVQSAFDYLTSYAIAYTDVQQRQLPEVNLTPEALTQAGIRLEKLKAALESGQAYSAEFSGQEINGALRSQLNADAARYARSAFITLGNQTIKLDLSVPLDFLEMEKFNNRFFNGSAEISLESRGIAGLEINLRKAELNGESLDQELLDTIETQRESKMSAEARQVLRRISGINITPEKLQIDIAAGPPVKME